jgi:hypothetical protein
MEDEKEFKESVSGLGYVFERMVQGMRNKMNTVQWKWRKAGICHP